MKPEILESYRMLANAGQQGKKSDAIRVLCDEIQKLQTKKAKREAKVRGFIPPTMEEIKAYARERHVNTLEVCEAFRDHHQARGWKLRTGPMVDWKAAFDTWHRNEIKFNPGNGSVETKSIGQRYAIG